MKVSLRWKSSDFLIQFPTAVKGWKDKVREIVGEGKIRAGVDSIGAKATEDIAELLAENGLLVSFGSMTGEMMQLSSGTVIFKQITVKGFWASTVSAQMAPEKRKSLMGELIKLVASGEIKLHTDAIFDLADITKAVARSLTPGRRWQSFAQGLKVEALKVDLHRRRTALGFTMIHGLDIIAVGID